MLRLVGVVETQNRLVKNWEGIWAAEVPSKERGVPVPDWDSQPRAPVPGIEAPTTSGCKKSVKTPSGGDRGLL